MNNTFGDIEKGGDDGDISAEDLSGFLDIINSQLKEEGLNINKENFIRFSNKINTYIKLVSLRTGKLRNDKLEVQKSLVQESSKAKIDFERKTQKPPKKVSLDIDTELILYIEKFTPPDLLEILGQQYQKINAILGLEDFEEIDSYDLEISNTNGNPAEHIQDEDLGSKIRLGIVFFLRTLGMHYNDATYQNLNMYSFFLGGMVFLLAHELYHKRQALIFPQFYSSRVAKYISASDDYEAYHKQVIEVGARAFARKYITYLNNNPNHIENDSLKLGIKTIIESFEDIQKVQSEITILLVRKKISEENWTYAMNLLDMLSA